MQTAWSSTAYATCSGVSCFSSFRLQIFKSVFFQVHFQINFLCIVSYLLPHEVDKPELAKAILKLQDVLQDAHEDHHAKESRDEGVTFNIQIQEQEGLENMQCVLDGGALLHRVWKRLESLTPSVTAM